MTQSDHPHTVLGESIRAFSAVVSDVTKRLEELEVPPDARDEAALRESTRSLEEAWSLLHQAQRELESEMHDLRELLEGERVRYRDLFEWAPDAYVVTDADGVILELNRSAERLLGHSRQVLTNTRLHALLDPRDRDAFRRMLDRLPSLERVGDWELNVRRFDGGVFAAAVTVSCMRDRSGCVASLRWLIRDITERKQAEEQVVAANVKLEGRVRERTEALLAVDRERADTLARLEAVLDQIPAAIVIADAGSRRVVTANDHAERLLEQVAGADATLDAWVTLGRRTDQSQYPPEERPIMRTLRTGEAGSGDQIEFERLDGTRGVFEVSAAPVRNPEGEIVAAVAAYWDVTDRERRARAEREFVTNAAHELRTPLAAVASAVEVLQSGAKEKPADRDRFLNHLEQQCDRLQRLVRSLLLLARAQTGQETGQAQVLDVRALLEEIRRYNPERVKLDLRCPPGTAVLAHQDLAEQALLNLVTNAAKYARAGDIVLSGAEENGFVSLEVIDQGPGIPPEERERVLERFYRGSDRDVAEGFGLGLSIASQVAEALHGKLELEQTEAGGTRARLLLPAANG